MANDANIADDENVSAIAYKILSNIDCDDFESSQKTLESIAHLKFGVYKKMIREYDPQNKKGFSVIVQFFSTFFADKKDAADTFGITVSTFYRWKSGDSCPHALIRSAVRDKIVDYLATNCPVYDDLSELERAARTMH